MNKQTLQALPPIHRIDAELCKASFFEFLKYFWEVVIPETPVYNWHIEYLCEELEKVVRKVARREPKDYDLIINIPPGTTKSTICTVMLPIWAWVVDPRIRTLAASYSGGLSTDHSLKSRDIIRSQKFKQLFPEIQIKKDQDGKTAFKNTNGGERVATSVTGTVTGFHAHLLIVDDPLNPKEASSEAQRLTANNFMDLTLSTRKVNKEMTPTILVMQRLHYQDCTGNWLEKKTDIKHICLPGELSKDVKPPELAERYINKLLDPIRLSRIALSQLQTDLGSYGYAGQIMQIPTPEGGGIWKQWFVPVPDMEFPLLDMDPDRPELPYLNQVGTDWDLAYTEKETNSASAYVTAGKLGEKMYIDAVGFKWVEFPDLMGYMKHQRSPHYIEAKASGKSAKQVLTNQGIPAIEVEVTGGDKIARAQMATPYAEAKMIYVRKSVLDTLYNDSRQGLLMFPNAHNDLNDALVQSINRLLAGHQVFTF